MKVDRGEIIRDVMVEVGEVEGEEEVEEFVMPKEIVFSRKFSEDKGYYWKVMYYYLSGDARTAQGFIVGPYTLTELEIKLQDECKLLLRRNSVDDTDFGGFISMKKKEYDFVTYTPVK